MKSKLVISFLILCQLAYSQNPKITVIASANSCQKCYETLSDFLFYENVVFNNAQYVILCDSSTNKELLVRNLFLPDSIKNKITKFVELLE